MLFRCNSTFWYVAQVGRMEVQSDQFRAALMDLLASPQVAVSSCEIYEVIHSRYGAVDFKLAKHLLIVVDWV